MGIGLNRETDTTMEKSFHVVCISSAGCTVRAYVLDVRTQMQRMQGRGGYIVEKISVDVCISKCRLKTHKHETMSKRDIRASLSLCLSATLALPAAYIFIIIR